MEQKTFKESRDCVHELKIKNQREWKIYCKGNNQMNGVPKSPEVVYKNNGWVSWGDWLNNGKIHTKKFLSYEDCQKECLKENITGKEKYKTWVSNNPEKNCPYNPDRVFKDKWVSWGTFLQTGKIPDIQKNKNYLAYSEAKEYIKKFNIKTEDEYNKWAKSSERPEYIPLQPRKSYKCKGGWVSFSDFLDNGFVTPQFKHDNFLNYQDAKKLVQSFSFNCHSDFVVWARTQTNIPINPGQTYEDFEGMPEFLGYQRNKSIGEKIISAIFVSNNINHTFQYSFKDCRDRRSLMFDIAFYRNEKFIGLVEFHGIQHYEIVERFGGEKSFNTNIKRDKIKFDYCKINNIPLLVIPYNKDLKSLLKNFMEQLGFEIDLSLEIKPALNRNFLTYNEAKNSIKIHKFKNIGEFHDWVKRPSSIPYSPDNVYKNNGWISWGDFLSHGKISVNKAKFVSFEECKHWFKENKIPSGEQWNTKMNKTKPNFIPSHPEKIYKKQWKGWNDFLDK